MSVSIEAVTPRTSGLPEAAHESSAVSGADFAAALRDFTGLDENHAKRFHRINMELRVDRTVYRDLTGCRSWLVW